MLASVEIIIKLRRWVLKKIIENAGLIWKSKIRKVKSRRQITINLLGKCWDKKYFKWSGEEI